MQKNPLNRESLHRYFISFLITALFLIISCSYRTRLIVQNSSNAAVTLTYLLKSIDQKTKETWCTASYKSTVLQYHTVKNPDYETVKWKKIDKKHIVVDENVCSITYKLKATQSISMIISGELSEDMNLALKIKTKTGEDSFSGSKLLRHFKKVHKRTYLLQHN